MLGLDEAGTHSRFRALCPTVPILLVAGRENQAARDPEPTTRSHTLEGQHLHGVGGAGFQEGEPHGHQDPIQAARIVIVDEQGAQGCPVAGPRSKCGL